MYDIHSTSQQELRFRRRKIPAPRRSRRTSLSTFHGYVGFIKHCIAGANGAWRRRQYRMAEELRKSARAALDELDAALGAPVDPETARRREVARAYAAVIQKGFGRP